MIRSRRRTVGAQRRQAGTVLAAVGLLALLAGASGGAAQAIAPVLAGSADYGGFADGVAINTGALGTPNPALLGATVSESSSAVDSVGGLDAAVTSELGRVVVPANAAANSYSRGLGLDVAMSGGTIMQSGLADSTAPPSRELSTSETGPVAVAPAAFASLVRGQAQSRFAPSSCILGVDIARGLGYTTNTQLAETGTGTGPFTNPAVGTTRANGTGAVDESISRQRLVKATDATGAAVGEGGLGILSETRQTIAPVTLLNVGAIAAVIPGGVQVEIAGPLVLKAVATGQPGAAYVTYAPEGATSPTTPVITVTAMGTTTVVTAQQIMDGGVDLALPPAPLPTLLTLQIGKPAHAIGSTGAPTIAPDGTSASAAVDAVRVQAAVAAAGVTAADIRIGHMEARAFVPSGGVACPGIGITKVSDKDPVKVGEQFTYTITVTNPYDCTLMAVKLVDVVASDTGITFTLGTATPPSSSSTADTVTFADIGPIPPMGTKQVMIPITVDAASKTGQLLDTATVTATCAVGSAQDDSSVVGQVTGLATIDLNGVVRLVAPKVTKDDAAVVTPTPTAIATVTPDTVLPRTGGDDRVALLAGAAALAGLAGLGLVRRRARASS